MGWQQTLATIFQGSGFNFNSAGEFFYSTPNPTFGNLEASITNSSGLDDEGNFYLTGITSYENQAGTYVAVNINDGQVTFWYSTAGAGGPYTEIGIIGYIRASNTLLVDTTSSGELQIGQNANQFILGSASIPSITLDSPFGGPIGEISVLDGSLADLNNAAGNFGLVDQPAVLTPFDRRLVDTTTNSNANQAGATRLSAIYKWNANTLKANTELELEIPFTLQNMEGNILTLGLSINGSATFAVSDNIGGAIVAAGVGVNGWFKANIKIVTTGAAGTYVAYCSGTIRQRGTNALFTNSAVFATDPITGTINTTVANDFRINSLWGGSNAGQNITAIGSHCIRSGT